MKTTVLSDGGWGTALALLLLQNGHSVKQWGPFADYIEEMRRTRRNDRFLKGAELPDDLVLTADMQTAVDGSELIVMASPTQYARGTIEQLADVGVTARQIITNVAKGIEMSSLKRVSGICQELLGAVNYAVLSGPSHAEEVYKDVPTAVVAAANDPEVALTVQQSFMNDRFRVYTTDDVVGVELGGALKNVLAIAAGICDGMELGDNAKAALLTRGITEMARLGEALGGRSETFSGLSGLGDIIVTCTSGHSRNRHVGEELGRGNSLKQITEDMGMVVAEGVATTKSVYKLSKQKGVATPIINEIFYTLYEDKNPKAAVNDLMTRSARPEMD